MNSAVFRSAANPCMDNSAAAIDSSMNLCESINQQASDPVSMEDPSIYGYEECTPSPLRHHDSFAEQQQQQQQQSDANPLLAMAMAVSASKTDHNNTTSKARMCPDKRKTQPQRSLRRRNGVGHSLLLKSAVLTAMDTEDPDTELLRRRDSLVSTASFNSNSSPRKRVRRLVVRRTPSTTTTTTTADEQHHAAVAAAGELLESLTVVRRNAPIRRISRRTSYEADVHVENNEDDDDDLSK